MSGSFSSTGSLSSRSRPTAVSKPSTTMTTGRSWAKSAPPDAGCAVTSGGGAVGIDRDGGTGIVGGVATIADAGTGGGGGAGGAGGTGGSEGAVVTDTG